MAQAKQCFFERFWVLPIMPAQLHGKMEFVLDTCLKNFRLIMNPPSLLKNFCYCNQILFGSLQKKYWNILITSLSWLVSQKTYWDNLLIRYLADNYKEFLSLGRCSITQTYCCLMNRPQVSI